MTNTQILWPGYELTVENDGQWVHTDMPGPDPDWRFVDAQGHGHFYKDKDGAYPTLTWVSVPCTMGHGDDCDAEGWYECRLCAERIQPGTKAQPPAWVSGVITYRLRVADGGRWTSYVFGGQQWDAVQVAVRQAVSATLGDFVDEVSYGGG